MMPHLAEELWAELGHANPVVDTQLMQNTFRVNAFATQSMTNCFDNFQQAMLAVLDTLPTPSQPSSSAIAPGRPANGASLA